MPYVSDLQRRWAHTPTGTEALGGPGKVAEWDQASKGKKLPERKGSSPAPSRTPLADQFQAMAASKVRP